MLSRSGCVLQHHFRKLVILQAYDVNINRIILGINQVRMGILQPNVAILFISYKVSKASVIDAAI